MIYTREEGAYWRNQWKEFFPNGYGVSVILSTISYGSDRGCFEVAVLMGNEKKSKLCYETPITSDVLGHLRFRGVADVIDQIKALPKKEK